MNWSEFLGLVLVAVALVFVPGVVVCRSAGLRWASSLGVAPAVTTGLVSVTAIAAASLHVSWGPLPVVGVTAVFSLLVAGVGRVVFRTRTRGNGPVVVTGLSYNGLSEAEQHVATSKRPIPNRAWWSVSAIGAIALMVYHIRVLIGRPSAFSQTFDAVFHLNAIRWIVDNRNGSSLAMTMTSGDGSPQFYPLGWHDLVSLTMLITGTSDVAAANNAMIMAVAAFAWVSGVMFLASVVVSCSPPTIVAVGFLASAFPSFPYLPLKFGVLYPNFLGLALLPGVLALTVQMFRYGVGARARVRVALPVGTVAVLGIALSHPNSVLLYMVLALPLFLLWSLPRIRDAFRQRNQRAAAVNAVMLVSVCVAVVLAWVVLRPPAESSTWEPPLTMPHALGEALSMAPLSEKVAWIPAIAVAAGAVWSIRKRAHIWELCSYGVVFFLWMVIASWSYGPLRSALVGNWYNDPNRIAAALPIAALPLAVIGYEAIVTALVTLAGKRATGVASVPTWVLQTALALLSVPLLLFTTQATDYLRIVIGQGAATYRVTDGSELVDSDELELLEQLPVLVPKGAVVATVPYNGSSMAYALEGVQTTTTHILYESTPDLDVLNESLNELNDDPQVCQAINDLRVQYVLDFGDQAVNNLGNWSEQYPGFEELDEVPGLTEIDQVGHAVLYRIDSCS